MSSSQSDTVQRLAELRDEMKSNKKQIQQLNDAHEAVHEAVSGIATTQELLRAAPNPEMPGMQLQFH